MIAIPLSSYFSNSLPLSAIGASVLSVLLQGWIYKVFSIAMIVANILLFSICAAISTALLILIFKVLFIVVGNFMMAIGEEDQIGISPSNTENFVEIKIDNKENCSFSGELKVMRINDEELLNPLLMPIIRGDNKNPQITIPKDESVGVRIGLFDNEKGYSYFTDTYDQKIFLPTNAIIHLKLSGKLDDGTEIIKEKEYISLHEEHENQKSLRLSYPLVIKNQIIGLGKLRMNMKMETITRKSK